MCLRVCVLVFSQLQALECGYTLSPGKVQSCAHVRVCCFALSWRSRQGAVVCLGVCVITLLEAPRMLLCSAVAQGALYMCLSKVHCTCVWAPPTRVKDKEVQIT
jgi:hypothetical protein